jgi:hypothetical protein
MPAPSWSRIDSVMINEEIAKWFGKTNAGIIGFVLTGNPRAERLAPKDILVEFRWLRDRAIALCTFGVLLRNAWVSDGPLPNTPKLPTREDQKNRQRRTADFRHNLGSARLDHLGRDRMTTWIHFQNSLLASAAPAAMALNLA